MPPPRWVAAVQAASRAFGVFAAGLILLSVGVICQMVFVRAVLGQSSIWQTEFVTFSLVAATFIGAPYILLTRGHVAVDVLPLMVSTPARRRLQCGLRTPQPGEPPGTLALDERLQAFAQDGGPIHRAGQLDSLGQQLIIDVDRGSHVSNPPG